VIAFCTEENLVAIIASFLLTDDNAEMVYDHMTDGEREEIDSQEGVTIIEKIFAWTVSDEDSSYNNQMIILYEACPIMREGIEKIVENDLHL